jgi:hypothetical protein
MTNKRPRVPIGLPIAAVATLLLGIAAGPVIDSMATEEQLATNVLLSAIPFVLIFVSIVLFFIILVWLVASMLNNRIPEHIYRPVEWITIGGIVLGIVGMFQPWSFAGYRYGFMLLFLSTLAFILWSHVVPKGTHADEVESMSVGEFEQSSVGGEQ